MDGLTECLVVLGYGIGIGVAGISGLCLLIGIYFNTRNNKQEAENEDSLVIPYSALVGGLGGGGGGAPQVISAHDIMRMRAAAMAAAGGPEEKKDEDKKETKDIGGGQYI